MEEAALWNDVFALTEDALGLQRGTIKATVLIETIPAAFEMDEILYALQEHIVGLNCGRWDYIFSYHQAARPSADRAAARTRGDDDGQAFLRPTPLLLINTCHRRGAFAMGGMAARFRSRATRQRTTRRWTRSAPTSFAKSRNGHDGTWVAHPGLVPIAMEVFEAMHGPNQLSKRPEHVPDRDEMLELHTGPRTERGARENIRVGVQYLAAWLGGKGAVPLYNLMEDAATAEISRAQLWQWLHFEAPLDDGRKFTRELFDALYEEEIGLLQEVPNIADASELFREMVVSDDFTEFLTLPAYERLD